jgi:hypothetical protein
MVRPFARPLVRASAIEPEKAEIAADSEESEDETEVAAEGE